MSVLPVPMSEIRHTLDLYNIATDADWREVIVSRIKHLDSVYLEYISEQTKTKK